MQRLGRIEGVSASGWLIVRASGKLDLKIGQEVLSSHGKRVGKIVDVVGPVSRPWVLIEGKAKIGQEVFVG